MNLRNSKGDTIKTVTLDVRMMQFSGIGAYIRNLVPLVIKSSPEIKFNLLGHPEEMEKLKGFIPGPKLNWVEMKSRIFTVSEQVELIQKIPREADLFWSPNYNFPIFWRGKLLVTVHDVFHLLMNKRDGSIPKWVYSRVMFNRLIHQSDALISVSQFTKSELVRRVGADFRKIHVINNGVNESWFKIKKQKNPHTKPYLLFVGNVKPHKNLGRLLEAYSILQDKIKHDLVIVGKKEGFITGDRSFIEKAKKMDKRIFFTGVVNDDLLAQYYAFSDLLVFPSLYEGFGLPPLEAMACGRPVVASKAASIPEVCGDAVLYFDPLSSNDMAFKIQKALQDLSLRKELIKKGKKRARLFNWDLCASQTTHLIKSLIEEKPEKILPKYIKNKENKLKIVYANNYLFPRGGAEKVFLDQKELFQRKGHFVAVFSQNHPDNLPDHNQGWFPFWSDPKQVGLIDGFPRFLKFVYSRENRRTFRGFLQNEKPDIVHVHNIYGGLTTALLDAARDMKIPVVMTLHDYKLVSLSPNLLSGVSPCEVCLDGPSNFTCLLKRCHRGSFKSTFAYYWETWFAQQFRKYDSVKYFIVPSLSMKKKIVSMGIDPQKVIVVFNTVRINPEGITRKQGKYFLFAGRMADEKGVAMLLETFGEFDGNLVLAGDGPNIKQYKSLVENKKNIQFVGQLNPSEIEKYYLNCLAVIVPSIWPETSSMTSLQAMACGKPVVASRIGALTEIVEEGETGFFFEPGNCKQLSEILKHLTSENGLAKRLGDQALKTFEKKYSQDQQYYTLLDIYKKVIGSNR